MLRARAVMLGTLAVLLVELASAQAPTSRPRMDSPLGWKWLLKPVAVPAARESEPIRGKIADSEYEIARMDEISTKVILKRPGPLPRTGVETDFRAVAYDMEGKRVEFPGGSGSGDSNKSAHTFILPAVTLHADAVRFVGIEVMDPAGRRKLSVDAQRRAREAKVAVLPTPEIGKPYEFSLKTFEGKPIRSADLRRHVILIDAWESSNDHSMRKMRALRKFYELNRNRLFEIVGINYDEKVERIDPTIRQYEMRWPQVHVPSDKSTRTLWHEASSIGALPRMLVIDRNGILRADCTLQEVEKWLVDLLAEPTEEDARPKR